jgi:hypothetical protein
MTFGAQEKGPGAAEREAARGRRRRGIKIARGALDCKTLTDVLCVQSRWSAARFQTHVGRENTVPCCGLEPRGEDGGGRGRTGEAGGEQGGRRGEVAKGRNKEIRQVRGGAQVDQTQKGAVDPLARLRRAESANDSPSAAIRCAWHEPAGRGTRARGGRREGQRCRRGEGGRWRRQIRRGRHWRRRIDGCGRVGRRRGKGRGGGIGRGRRVGRRWCVHGRSYWRRRIHRRSRRWWCIDGSSRRWWCIDGSSHSRRGVGDGNRVRRRHGRWWRERWSRSGRWRQCRRAGSVYGAHQAPSTPIRGAWDERLRGRRLQGQNIRKVVSSR